MKDVVGSERVSAAHAAGRFSAAFTLVELLVVIGIIALLISILLPGLSRARAQATQLKCASALREIGNATVLYASDYRGYLIPARVTTASTPGTPAGAGVYTIGPTAFGAATSVTTNGVVLSTTTTPYWQDFLAPIIARNKKLGTTSVTAAEAADAQTSVLWGCPSFDKYASTATGGFNRTQTGYGINYLPVYTSTYPDPGRNLTGDSSATAPAVFTNKSMIVSSKDKWTSPTPIEGTWFRLTQISKPSERAFIGDAQFWLIESLAVPDTGVIPGQKFFNNSFTYSSGTAGASQTLFDFYRHGRFPPVEVSGNGGYYKTTGGRVAYNILYFDGHVEQSSDRSQAYRSVRMRFPQ